MQRILSILLLLVYVSLAAGVNVLHHSCGGAVEANFAPVSQEDPCGCADIMDPSDRCCTVEVKSFQLTDDQPAPAVIQQPTPDVLVFEYAPATTSTASDPAGMTFASVEPPPPRAVPATILHCFFLI